MATMNPLQESACNAGDTGSIPGSGRSLGGGKWRVTPVFLPGQRKKSTGQRSLVGYSPKGLSESDMTEQLSKLVSYYGEMLSVLAVFSSTPSSHCCSLPCSYEAGRPDGPHRLSPFAIGQ